MKHGTEKFPSPLLLPLALSLVIFISGCISGPDLSSGPAYAQQDNSTYEIQDVQITASRIENVDIAAASGTLRVIAEIAVTPEKQQRGLMFRTSLGENEGMLFVFSNEELQTFWMKDTLIPLDMIFIDSAGTVVDVKKNVQPCKADPCPTYTSKQAAQHVLEVNSGFSDKYGIAEGNVVTVPEL